MDNNISFSKIVATPTLNSWSQAYNAGKLFAVLSLEKTDETEEVESLNMLGKDLLERLEQEFFAIEDKNLESIKKAISVVFDQEIKGVTISFAAGALVNNILYLFGLGKSQVFIKRNGSLGLALNSGNITTQGIASSSGFLKEKDLVVLTTEAFSQVVAQDDLDISLDDSEPSEITETLAPKIHKAENGKISAIVLKYKTLPLNETQGSGEIIDEGTEIDEPIEVNQEEKSASPFYKFLSLLKSIFKKPNFKTKLNKKLFLVTTIIIVGVIISSICLAIQEQNNTKVRTLFAEIYPQAQKKYDEGQGLVDLNKSLARDSFSSAQKILQDSQSKFPPKSKELVQTQDLLKKVEAGLTETSPIDKSGLDRSKLSIAVKNGSGVEGTAGKAATILKGFGYNVSSTGNADNFNYIGVTIKVKKESSNFLDLLKKDLAKDYTVKSASSDLASDSPTEALIIIGK